MHHALPHGMWRDVHDTKLGLVRKHACVRSEHILPADQTVHPCLLHTHTMSETTPQKPPIGVLQPQTAWLFVEALVALQGYIRHVLPQ
jgi:hypothetical protein